MPKLLKRIRTRFGISAPRVAVRTHLAWYWRWLGMILVGAITLALAAWMYDAGRRFAGFDRRETEQELARLSESARRLEDEAARLRAIASAGESRLKIEQAAQSQLAAQVKALEEERARLKEDLAFFENLVPAGDKLEIHRFKVERDALPGEYRYRLLLLQGGRRERPFQGSLQLLVSVQEGGRDAMITLPAAGDSPGIAYRLSFKHFFRVEGNFRVPAAAKVRSVQARVLESGSNQARATQQVDLS